ncbi:hypothetical protein IKG64_02890 [Candidatus Saccharibacteria bacterium]|nr:hypothetical protein [Candidatus Saccharibacteria bacterium]
MPDESSTPVMPPVGGVVDAPDLGAPMGGAAGAGAPVVDSQPTVSPVVVAPVSASAQPDAVVQPTVDTETPAEVARKIGESHNVLIALSSDPSVDELAAAIGLSIYLDRLGKRATAIYSGATPNALEFLNPEETFEATADTLQDFVIALNKDKADHLRYKLDGDYVKIYITPYRHRLSEEDLEFSYGDYNVDLVLALDVANGIDLDSALREHGRIMHDAAIINITTGNPGKFGEIEWSDKTASSVSEMIAGLLYSLNSKAKIEKEEATAFLTGIVAATNRFSNAGTTPETMKMASRLMESGANQQLISKNITPDMDNEMFMLGSSLADELGAEKRDGDPTKLDIEHGNEESVDESKEVSDTITEKESTLLDDLKAAEASLANAGAETTPDISNRPVKLDELRDEPIASAGPVGNGVESVGDGIGPVENNAEPVGDSTESVGGDVGSMGDSVEPAVDNVEPTGGSMEPAAGEAPANGDILTMNEAPVAAAGGAQFDASGESGLANMNTMDSDAVLPEVGGGMSSDKPEKVIAPSGDFSSDFTDEGTDKYSKMLEDALAGTNGNGAGQSDIAPSAPIVSNPAAMSAPAVPENPEINGVPSINYMPMPGEEVLPPPPTPPISADIPMEPTMPATDVAAPVVGDVAPVVDTVAPVVDSTAPAVDAAPIVNSDAVTPVDAPQDPAAFRIPGM